MLHKKKLCIILYYLHVQIKSRYEMREKTEKDFKKTVTR